MMNRRALLGMTGAAGAALAVGMIPGLKGSGARTNRSSNAGKNIRICPVPGVSYSAATLAFMQRARFETPRQAIYGMKDPNIQFLIEHVSA